MNRRLKIKAAKNKNGFSLAEVLLALTIVGVIASLTIPDLIQNIQSQKLRASWKKSFSVLSQAATMMDNDNGASSPWNAVGSDADADSATMRNAFANYLHNLLRDTTDNVFQPYFCTSDGSGSCWNDFNDPYNSGAMTLADGTTLQFNVAATAGPLVADTASCNGTRGSLSNICGYITVDVNGVDAPNLVGTDVFSLWIIKRPNGGAYTQAFGSNDNTTCLTGNSFGGNIGCSYYALIDTDY